MAIELEELLLPDEAALRSWLSENHTSHPGVKLVLHKKGGNVTALTYAQALDQALCFGWIDGQRMSRDEHSFAIRFTPRTKKSIWSARNVEIIARLTDAGLMSPRGNDVVEAAKADGRWEKAYAGQKDAQLPDDFLAALAEHPAAEAKLATLGASERFAIYFRLHNAKREETRAKRIAEFVAKLDADQGIF